MTDVIPPVGRGDTGVRQNGFLSITNEEDREMDTIEFRGHEPGRTSVVAGIVVGLMLGVGGATAVARHDGGSATSAGSPASSISTSGPKAPAADDESAKSMAQEWSFPTPVRQGTIETREQRRARHYIARVDLGTPDAMEGWLRDRHLVCPHTRLLSGRNSSHWCP